MKTARYLGSLALLAIVGCSESPPSEPAKPTNVFEYESQAPTTAAPVAPPAPAQPATEQVKAEVGVGKKGHGYGGGLITEPVHQYFSAREAVAFEVQIPKAMQLYKAANNDKGPPTHEAYMRDIIEANAVQLPELPEGHRYVYDPKTEQLMVERPATANEDSSSQ